MSLLKTKLVICLILSGCGDAADRAVVTRDSAGVRISENRAPAETGADAISVDSQPVLRIGSLDDEAQQLNRVMDAIRLPDGRIIVANSGNSELRIYSPTGALERKVGRAGEGPGEFSSPRWIQLWRDTLVVFDPLLDDGRISYFNARGDFLSSARVVVTGMPYPSPRAILADGSFLDERSKASIGTGEVGHVIYTRYPIKYNRDGTGVDTIAELSGIETFREHFRGGIAQWDVPFGRTAMSAATKDWIYFGNGGQFTIEGFTHAGKHDRSIRAPAQAITITKEMAAAWIEQRVAPMQRRPEAAAQWRARYAVTPIPRHAPEYGALVADTEGRLWTKIYSIDDAQPNRWRVFDRNGRWLSDVVLASGFSPFEIGSDYLLGVRRDELDVEYVEFYRLR